MNQNDKFVRTLKRVLYHTMNSFDTIIYFIIGIFKLITFFIMIMGLCLIFAVHDSGYGLPTFMFGVVTFVLCHYLYNKYYAIVRWLDNTSK